MQPCRSGRRRKPHPFAFQPSVLLWLAVALLTPGYAQCEPQLPDRVRQPFSHAIVVDLARQLTRTPFEEPEEAPEILTQLNASTYRQIHFRQNEAVWGGTPTKFSVQLFPPGFIYKDLIDIGVVEYGWAYPLDVTPSTFSVPEADLGEALVDVGKYAGMRLHYPLNGDKDADAFIVFQGASFFRAISKGQTFGQWARGLAVDVAQPTGEEQPLFRRFWIERPSAHHDAIVVHALLDCSSVAGAFRFGIYPGTPTSVEIDVVLFPRRDVPFVGLAPLTSMFLHGPVDPPEQADYRSAVHNAEGLAMIKGNGERLWRPLNNPQTLQISAFIDENPRGFGLIQRPRAFRHYQDLEAHFERRPSAWVEPRGDWGPGRVELIEIPSGSEANDNIVVYWRPADGLKKGLSFAYTYRLTWPNEMPQTAGTAGIVRSSGGRPSKNVHEMVIDYNRLNAESPNDISVEAATSQGRILESRVVPHPSVEGVRVFLRFDPEGADAADLRLQLMQGDQPAAPTWLYRWLREDWP